MINEEIQENSPEISLTYRHDTPSFEKSDWSFMTELSSKTLKNSGYFKSLSDEEKDYLNTIGFKQSRWFDKFQTINNISDLNLNLG